MSEPKTPTLEEHLYHNVFVPEFLEKCAELGVPIKTEEDAHLALDMASRLEIAETTENSSLLKNASVKLARAVPGVLSSDEPSEDADVAARAAQYVNG